MSPVGDRLIEPGSRLDVLVAEYLHAIQAGHDLDRKQLLLQNPDLTAELQDFFEDHDWMHELAGEPLISDNVPGVDDSQLSMGTTIVHAAARQRQSSAAYETPIAAQMGAFGDYELLNEIARGGMGVIYKARQSSLNRIVALKMIRSSHLASQEEIDRFRSEAETAAGLDHPGIVPIFEVGEQAGQQYYSMALVDGISLSDVLRQEQVLSPQTAAELVRRVAVAIEYAHGKGVIHRDLKPANVLLARSLTLNGIPLKIDGEEQYCEPKVTDFGLAKRLESDSGLTGTGQILGTPSYMAPEQAAGQGDNLGPLADVYSLGAVLYCLLTGRPPFRAANVLETLKQVIHDEPVPPRQLNSAIPHDLETICLKCLNKAPTKRYDSALEFAKDLQRYLNGEPVLARPTGFWERSWKWVKRRPAVASLVVVGSIAALTSVGLAVGYTYQQERERILYAARTMSALQWFQNNDPMRAKELLDSSHEYQRGFEYDFLYRLIESRVLQTLDGETFVGQGQRHGMYDNLGGDVEYDREGRFVAASMGRGPVLIWDVIAGTDPLKLEGHLGKVHGLAFSGDSQYIATAGNDGSIKIWKVSDGTCVRSLEGHVQPIAGENEPTAGIRRFVNAVDFSCDSAQIASGGADGTVRLWDVSTGELLKSWSGIRDDIPKREVKDVVFSPDGQWLAAACTDGQVRLFHPQTLSLLQELPASKQDVYSLSFDPQGRRIAAAGKDGRVHIWDVHDRREQVICEGHPAGVVSIAFSPNGQRLASGGMFDQILKIWDANTGRLVQSMDASRRERRFTITRDFGQISFHPTGRTLAIGGDDNQVRIWNLGQDREAQELVAHGGPVRSLAFTNEGTLATAGEDGLIKLWAGRSVELLNTIRAHTGSVNAVTLSPDGKLLASAGQDKSVKLWNPANGQLLWERSEHREEVYGVAFHQDGRLLVSSSHDGQILLRNVSHGQVLAEVSNRTEYGDDSPVSSLAFQNQGDQLAVGGWDGNVSLYSVSDSSLLRSHVLKGHEREIQSLAFSRDGRLLVSCDRDGQIIVWDVQRRRQTALLPDKKSHAVGHIGPATAAIFSSAGNRVVSSGWDGLLNVWDTSSSQVVLTLNGRHGRVYCVALSDDDKSFASGHHDGTVMLWGK